jgi:hypothetical protein
MKNEKEKLEKKVEELKKNSEIVIFCENSNADDLNKLKFNNINFLNSDSKIYAFDTAKKKDVEFFL